jgi:hypothetical protein
METITYELAGLVPESNSEGIRAAGIKFVRLEMAIESSPLALVWYTVSGSAAVRGSRIDLEKQVFLDNFGDCDRGSLNAEAKWIVRYVNSTRSTRAMASWR